MRRMSKTLVITDADSSFDRDTRNGIQHNFNLSSPQRILKYLTVNPNVRYVEEWFNESVKKYIDENDELIEDSEKGFYTRRTFSSGVSVNTKIYGMFNMNLGKLKTIRHVLTPSISFSYTPDFSASKFGYYDAYTDTTGEEVKYDRFQNSIFGSTRRGKSKVMSFNLDNLIQARTVDGEEENKFDILGFNSSTSYNFEAPEGREKWGQINTGIRLQKFFTFNANVTHSLYKYNPDGPAEFLYDSDKSFFNQKFVRLTSFSTSTSFRFSGKGPGTDRESEPDPLDLTSETGITPTDPQSRFFDEEGLSDMEIPWSFNGNISFRYNSFNPERVTKTIQSRTNLDIKITKNWNVRHSAQFDLVNKEIRYQDYQIYRDLHCWQLSFNWTPSGGLRSGYFLEIRIKDPKLSDIKVRKTAYGGSVIGW